MLLSKKVNGQEVLRCDCCGDELDEMDLIEIMGEELKRLDEVSEQTVSALSALGDATLETDMLLTANNTQLRRKLDLITEYLGIEFEVIPEVPAVPAKMVVKKAKKKK